MLTKGLTKELSSCNIRINALAPGAMETQGSAGEDEMENHIIEQTRLGRLRKVEDIANCAARFRCNRLDCGHSR